MTRAKSHAFKLEFVCVLLSALRNVGCSIGFLDVIVTLDPANVDIFKLSAVTGDNNLVFETDHKQRPLSWNKNHIRRLRLGRHGLVHENLLHFYSYHILSFCVSTPWHAGGWASA